MRKKRPQCWPYAHTVLREVGIRRSARWGIDPPRRLSDRGVAADATTTSSPAPTRTSPQAWRPGRSSCTHGEEGRTSEASVAGQRSPVTALAEGVASDTSTTTWNHPARASLQGLMDSSTAPLQDFKSASSSRDYFIIDWNPSNFLESSSWVAMTVSLCLVSFRLGVSTIQPSSNKN